MIHDEPGLKVHKVKTEDGACALGQNTKWCTAAKRNNQFEAYNKQGPLYVVHHTNPKTGAIKKRHLFHFKTESYADEQDREHNVKSLIKKHPKLKNVKEFQAQSVAFHTVDDKWKDKNLHSSNPKFREKVAEEGTDKHRDHLKHDEDPNVRRAVAIHGNDKHRDHLINDEDWVTRGSVARHGTDKHRDHLLHDRRMSVRMTVAATGNDKHRDHLKNDEDISVRESVMNHGNKEHLQHIASNKKEEPWLMQAAKRRLKKMDE